MKKGILFGISIFALALLISGCVTVSPERSVKTYSNELGATKAALADASERGAREECPEAYMAADAKKYAAVDIFWTCRTAEAIAMLKEARKDAEDLCGGEQVAMEVDSDGDGVLDDKDKCPNKPETLNGFKDDDGCPDKGRALVVVTEDRIEVKQKIMFETGSSKIKGEKSFEVLDIIGKILAGNTAVRVSIEGHTDNRGKADKNRTLSKERAESVKSYLKDKGVDDERLETVGWGPDKPIASNKKRPGRTANRRVEFIIIRPEKTVITPEAAPADGDKVEDEGSMDFTAGEKEDEGGGSMDFTITEEPADESMDFTAEEGDGE